MINFSTEIAATCPPEVGVRSWRRSYQLKRGKSFKISDKFQLTSNSGETSINFLTSCCVDTTTPGRVELGGEGFALWLSYNSPGTTVSEEPIDIRENKLKRSWPGGLARLVFSSKKMKLSGEKHLTIINLGCLSTGDHMPFLQLIKNK